MSSFARRIQKKQLRDRMKIEVLQHFNMRLDQYTTIKDADIPLEQLEERLQQLKGRLNAVTKLS